MQENQKNIKENEEISEELLNNVTGGTGILGIETGDIKKALKDIKQNSTAPEVSR